jgi:hypothetical protein
MKKWIEIGICAGLLMFATAIFYAQFHEESDADVRREIARRNNAARLELAPKMEPMVKEFLTNTVVGLSRIIEMKIPDFDSDELNGAAVVEFINKSGGVERTNIYYAFTKRVRRDEPASMKISPDFGRISKEESKKFEAELSAVRNAR